MDEQATFRLAFHIEAPASAAEPLKDKIAQIDGVRSTETRVAQPARAIDAQSVGMILVIITGGAKSAAVTAGYIEETVKTVKRIAAEIGLTKVSVEKGRKKRDTDQLSHADFEELAEESAVKPEPDRRPDSDA